MLNQKFINKLLTLAILSICSNVVNASTNMKGINDGNIVNNSKQTITCNDSPKSDNSTMSSNSNKVEEINLYSNMKNSPEINNKNTVNENIIKEVKYDPDKMWFDYQTLFNNTKNNMLEKSDTKPSYVRHTNFCNNTIALHALFNSDDFDSSLFDSAMSGNIFSQYMLLDHFTDYVRGIYSYDELKSLSSEQLRLVGLNYNLFIKILLSLKDDNSNEIINDCIQLIREYPVEESISRSLNIGGKVKAIFCEPMK